MPHISYLLRSHRGMANKLRIGPGVKILEEPLKSIAEFENWRHSVVYNLRLDGEFKPYLKEDFEFGVKTKLKPSRNLKDTTGENAKTKEEKCSEVDFMLEQIAQYCPKIPHNDIVRDCGSLADVWQVIRLHSSIETSGALLNDAWNISRLPNETPQALYSRIKQAYDDNLIRKNTLKYQSIVLTEDEEMSPTLHCTIILHWLQVLHPKLRDLVTQRFCTELRNKTYASIWPEICRSVDTLLKELSEDGTICRYGDNSRYDAPARPPLRSRGSYQRFRGSPSYRSAPVSKHCDYCRVLGRRSYQTHTIEDCLFLKKERQDTHGSSRAVDVDDYDDHYEEFREEYPSSVAAITEHYINQVSVNASPSIIMYYEGRPYNLTLDTGGTCNALDTGSADEMHCEIRATNQRARMADGRSSLDVIGETDIVFMRDGKSFRLTALVCNISEPTILAGMPFMVENDIAIRPAKAEVIIGGSQTIKYNSHKSPSTVSRRLNTYTVRSSSNEVVLPGESISFQIPTYLCSEKLVAVEPRYDNSYNQLAPVSFPVPRIHEVSKGLLTLSNTTDSPVMVKKNAHVCNIQPPVPDSDMPPISSHSVQQVLPAKKSTCYSLPVQVNPDGVLTAEESSPFRSLLNQYDEVFNPVISRYNGYSGAVFVEVNMGPQPPPQHKGRVPFYGRNNMVELQEKFDVLTSKGVFSRPQDIGVTVEVINPSFLVKKKSSDDKRLVTDFGAIAKYCRPSPTLMPDVDSTLRQIATWKYLIKTDLTEAYFQIPLRKSSMKYCGVVSPMKGVLVYTAGCMGLPGTEVALEELTCLLFGHLVMQGKVVKLADDLFIGADNPSDLCANFEEVLGIMLENNLRLSAKKTIVSPRSVMILGWIWENGFLKAGPHRLSALSECDPPSTVKALKSYIGAYRFLSRVIKNYASLMIPLESMISGKPAANVKLEWSPERLQAFHLAQAALKDAKSIVLPKPDDVLQIVTDAAIQPTAIGAVLYAIRGDKTLLAGFFNVKLPVFQRRWLPCELEGVAIGAALNHFAPYILQSNHRPYVLTDSKACVQAVEKLNRGEYSASSRLCTFLSSVSRYLAVVKHIPGTTNITSDFISRNPVMCENPKCQICTFLKDSMSSVVATVSVPDILEGRVHLPFTNKRSWVEVQEECSDLRHVFKFLRNGTTPGKKGRNLRQVKRYITSKVVISSVGTLVVRHIEPFNPVSERIVVPQQVLHGVLTVLHIKLNHPSSHQLMKVFSRFFFALNLDKAVNQCARSCHQCMSLKEIPKALVTESTDDPPDHFAQKFAADIIKRNSQLILVLRECMSSYTQAQLINNETVPEIATGIQRLSNLMRPSPLTTMTIRLDPHPSHKSMFSQVKLDKGLAAHNIKLEIGRELNVNHNPVAEKAIRELIKEILVLTPEGGAISSTTLSQATANLNSRLRAPGVSAHEVFTQRNQTTGTQLSLDDLQLIQDQHRRRISNHAHSERCKAGNKPPHSPADISIGDIVYLYEDGSKLSARPRYVVLAVEKGWCKLRRFADKRLGNKTYDAKLTECYKVPDEFTDITLPPYPLPEEDDDILIHVGRDASVNQDLEESVHAAEDETSDPEEVTEDDSLEDETPDPEDHCSMCNKEVTADDDSLECDECNKWCHRTCSTMSDRQYRMLRRSDEDFNWSCSACSTEITADQQDDEDQYNDDDPLWEPPDG